MIDRILNIVDGLQPLAAVFIRFAFGYHLLQYTYEDILFLQAHTTFGPYLQTLGVPFPEFTAYLVLGTEFMGGALMILGLWVRVISIPLMINFITAYLLVHLHQPYLKSFEAIQMLAVSFFLLFNGAGSFSLDAYFKKRKAAAEDTSDLHRRRRSSSPE